MDLWAHLRYTLSQQKEVLVTSYSYLAPRKDCGQICPPPTLQIGCTLPLCSQREELGQRLEAPGRQRYSSGNKHPLASTPQEGGLRCPGIPLPKHIWGRAQLPQATSAGLSKALRAGQMIPALARLFRHRGRGGSTQFCPFDLSVLSAVLIYIVWFHVKTKPAPSVGRALAVACCGHLSLAQPSCCSGSCLPLTSTDFSVRNLLFQHDTQPTMRTIWVLLLL